MKQTEIALIVAQVVAAMAKTNKPKKAYPKVKGIAKYLNPKAVAVQLETKVERQLKMVSDTVKAFEAKGFGIVKPRVDVLTYNRWLANGRRVIPGSKGLRVNGIVLFHISQTDVAAQLSKSDLSQIAKLGAQIEPGSADCDG